MTPLKSIRKYCLWCCNDQANEVKLCPSTDCVFYDFRFGKKNGKTFTIKIMRKKCFDCGEGTSPSIKECEFTDCPLYSYRCGTNPNRKGKGNQKGNITNLMPYIKKSRV